MSPLGATLWNESGARAGRPDSNSPGHASRWACGLRRGRSRSFQAGSGIRATTSRRSFGWAPTPAPAAPAPRRDLRGAPERGPLHARARPPPQRNARGQGVGMMEMPVRGAAAFSDCGNFRYYLERIWDESVRPLAFIMLNPSTADAAEDDPTIRRCIAFARREGAGGLTVGNLFAWRSTDPSALRKCDNPEGPDNAPWLRTIARDAGRRVVCAWGVHGAYRDRAETVLRIMRVEGVECLCLGRTKQGHPRHPLYLPADAALEPLTPADARAVSRP